MSDDRKISVALEPEQIAALEQAVDAGEYSSSGEIVREAIRDWQLKRALGPDDIARLRQLWDAGKLSGRPVKFDIGRTLKSARKPRGKIAE
ncbi:MAG TPA: type II toxin-antitoxin system ParD family antitoxin [Pseudolabrys sp.]